MAINERTRLETPVDLAPYEIDQATDIQEAVRRVRAEAKRVVVAAGGEPVAAVIPMDDLYLLLRLEEAELGRIDLEEIAKREADPDERPIPWDEAKMQLDL